VASKYLLIHTETNDYLKVGQLGLSRCRLEYDIWRKNIFVSDECNDTGTKGKTICEYLC
jgi:hypothetical protein